MSKFFTSAGAPQIPPPQKERKEGKERKAVRLFYTEMLWAQNWRICGGEPSLQLLPVGLDIFKKAQILRNFTIFYRYPFVRWWWIVGGNRIHGMGKSIPIPHERMKLNFDLSRQETYFKFLLLKIISNILKHYYNNIMPKKKSQPEIEIPAKLKNRPSLWKNPDVLPKITASRKTVDESLISDPLRHDFISVKKDWGHVDTNPTWAQKCKDCAF